LVNCVHGIDSRFCAVCNKASAFRPSGAIGSATLAEILEFLGAERVTATRRAIAEVLGVGPRSLDGQLGADTGSESISSGMELALRMTAWKAKRRP
jgi:hypothetical protein